MGAAALSAVALAGCSTDGPNNGTELDKSQEAATEATQVANQGESQVVSVTPTEENVRLIGRTYEEDDARWLPQSGSAVEFKATGTRIKIEMVGDENVNNESNLQPRFAVLVDGKVVLDETLGESPHIVDVPVEGPFSNTVFEVIHLSEATRGAVGIRSISVETNAPAEPRSFAPVKPTAAKGLSIAFVGDSITCAYGVEAESNDGEYQTTTQNFMKDYAYITAQALGADYETVCYSGFGIVSGYSGDGERNDEMLVPPLYENVTIGQGLPWDFEAHPRDVVVVNLGTNDFSYTGTVKARMKEFTKGYSAFLGRIRELNPDSLIVCTLGTMWGSEALYPALEKAVLSHSKHTGDKRVVCYLSDPLDEKNDAVVLNGHPDEKGQRKIADTLVREIRRALDNGK